jgi:tyrosyl-tRNA synthetase
MSIDPTTGGLIFPEDQVHSKKGAGKAQKAEESKDDFSSINSAYNPQLSTLSVEEKFNLCKSVGEEVLKEEWLMALIKQRHEAKEFFTCYDGFEPSGRMHIAQGLLKTVNVNKMVKAGGIFIFWVADWFAALNLKFNGDLEKIRTVGKYFIEIWKATGMDL